MDPDKAQYAQKTDARTLAEVIDGADMFLGLSAGGVLKPEMVAKMAARPLILALANPTPELTPQAIKTVSDDAAIATGSHCSLNQVNNYLCSPFIRTGHIRSEALPVGKECAIRRMYPG